MSKKVSVIISCFNSSKPLIPLLDSVFNQDYENFEVIAVDDCSTDNTYEVLKTYAKNRQNMTVLHLEKNKGLSSGRNAGYEKASGEYILFCDSDDVVTSDYISTLVKNMEEQKADLSICNFKRIKEQGKKRGQNKHKLMIFEKEKCVEELFRQKTFDICVWNKLYKKEILDKFNIRFNEDVLYAEDIGFNYNYFKHCDKIVYDKKVCYFYIRRDTGLVKTPINPRKLTGFIDVKLMIEDSEKNYKQFVPYTRGWLALTSFEFLYYIFKFKYDDKETTRELLKNMKDNIKYLKQAKRMVWHRKHLMGLAYFVAKMFLGNKIKD